MKVGRFPSKHPRCTCPDVTFANLNVDRSQCAGGTIVHPVLTVDDVQKFTSMLKEHK